MSRTKKLKDVSTLLAEALKLSLADRVKIKNELQSSITKEVAERKDAAKEAEEIANGMEIGDNEYPKWVTK